MLVQEFTKRTGYEPSAQEYTEIESAYNAFEGNKDAFCKAWTKANPHKAGTLWAKEKEYNRRQKVFASVVRFVERCKATYENTFQFMNYPQQQGWMDDMCKKCKCKDREELRDMLFELGTAYGLQQAWTQQQRQIYGQIELMA